MDVFRFLAGLGIGVLMVCAVFVLVWWVTHGR